MTLITIVTCTWNAAASLPATLDSVLAQTHPHVEHLIIDGASTDGTASLARDYQQRSDAARNGHTVMVTSEPDGGLYDAMNKGIRSARGQYILFLNAGDRLPTAGTLAAVARAAEQGDGTPQGDDAPDERTLPGVLYGDTDIIDAEGRFVRHRRLSPPRRLTWRSFMRGMVVCHQAFYARTDLARLTPYDLRYRYSADVDWCIRVMRLAHSEGAPLVRVPGVVALFLDGGMTTANHRASLRERFRVMARHYGLLPTVAMHAWFALRAVAKR